MNSRKRAMAVLLGASALLAGTGLTISSAWLITMAAEHPPILVLSVSIVLVRFFGISRSAARYAERLYSHEAVFRGLTALRTKLYERLTSSSSEFIRRVDTAGLVKSIVDNLERAQEYSLRVTLPARQAVFSLAIGNLIALWIYPPLLAVMLPVSIALLFLIPAAISRRNSSVAASIEVLENRYAVALEQSAGSSIEANLYNFAQPLESELARIQDEIASTESALLRHNRVFQWITQFLLAMSLCASAWIVASSHHIASVKISMAIFLPLVSFEAIALWYPNIYQSGKLLRAQQTLDELESEFSTLADAELIGVKPDGSVEITNAQVAWEKHFAQPVSLSANRGDVVVIRGESGAGKSTLSMAVLGLIDYRGSIKVSGVEVAHLSDVHAHIAPSLQSGHIFNTTIRENVKIARPEASDGEIFEVLASVELNEIALDEVIGQYGRQLSGGEAKRLGVARALLSPAPIVLLDEPTEHLDSELAIRVESAIRRLCENRTLIVITHAGWLNSSKTVVLTRE